jgi:hypothetical protein
MRKAANPLRAIGSVLLLALSLVVVSALPAASAVAATRYAAPGGTGADPCVEAAPCLLYVAAAENAPGTTVASGDVVEVEPGTYSEAAGDLGPSDFIQLGAGVTVRGAPGAARPLIKLEANSGFWGAFLFFGGKLEGVEILNEGNVGAAFTIGDTATVEGVVARSLHSPGFTCSIQKGLIRDSVCLNEDGGAALGASSSTFAANYAIVLRNVTAIAGGTGSYGIDFGFFGSGVNVTVDAKAVIAHGEEKDVRARGVSTSPGTPGTGADVAIALDHSDYATTDTVTSGGGSASVTAAGSGTNITAPPSLAGDGYHQLAGSPTVDKGALDGSSGSADIDGQLRAIGSAADIGADELGQATATSVSCPASVVFSSPMSETVFCTATVTDTSPSMSTPPGGDVSFEAGGGIHSGFCVLAPASATSSSCQMSYSPVPASVGSQTVSAAYGGDSAHEPSAAATTIEVVEKAGSGGGSSGSTPRDGEQKTAPWPATTLIKHPARRTAKRSTKFSFASDGPGSTFECKLDKRRFRPCASPFKRTLGVGRHLFSVRAVNTQGLPDQTPAVFRWRILAAK